MKKTIKQITLEVITTTSLVLAVMPTIGYLWNGELNVSIPVMNVCVLAHIWLVIFVYANCFWRVKSNNTLKRSSLELGAGVSLMLSACPTMWYIWNDGQLKMNMQLTILIALAQVWLIAFIYASCFWKRNKNDK